MNTDRKPFPDERTARNPSSCFGAIAARAVGCCLMAMLLNAAELQFKHFTIANPLPGAAWGTAGIPLADLDRDGDLDAALSRRDAQGFWWYERRTDAVWIQHLVCDSKEISQSLGAAALDVDNDGWADLVFSFVWFKNPGTLRQNPDAAWQINPFPGSGHDLLAAARTLSLSTVRRSSGLTLPVRWPANWLRRGSTITAG